MSQLLRRRCFLLSSVVLLIVTPVNGVAGLQIMAAKRPPSVELVDRTSYFEKVVAVSDGCFQTENELIYCDRSGGYWQGAELGVLKGKKVIKFAFAWDHVCALTADGKVGCSGNNDVGQLGDGTTKDSDIFVEPKIPGAYLTIGIREIKAAYQDTCVITNSNELVCWGLADGRILQSTGRPIMPTVIKNAPIGDLSVVDIDFGDSYYNPGCVAGLGRKIRCYDRDSNSNIDSYTEVDTSSIQAGDEIVSLVGVGGDPGQLCVLTKNGEVHCQESFYQRTTSGAYSYTRAGNYWKANIKLAKILLSDLAIGLDGGFNSSYGKRICALLRSGDLECWGGGFAREKGLGQSDLPNVILKVKRSTIFTTTTQFSIDSITTCDQFNESNPRFIFVLSPEGGIQYGPTSVACDFERNNPITHQEIEYFGSRSFQVSMTDYNYKAKFRFCGRDICINGLDVGETAFFDAFGPPKGHQQISKRQYFSTQVNGKYKLFKEFRLKPGKKVYIKVEVQTNLGTGYEIFSVVS